MKGRQIRRRGGRRRNSGLHGRKSQKSLVQREARRGRAGSKKGFILGKGYICRDEELSGGQMVALIPFLERRVPDEHTTKGACIELCQRSWRVVNIGNAAKNTQ